MVVISPDILELFRKRNLEPQFVLYDVRGAHPAPEQSDLERSLLNPPVRAPMALLLDDSKQHINHQAPTDSITNILQSAKTEGRYARSLSIEQVVVAVEEKKYNLQTQSLTQLPDLQKLKETQEVGVSSRLPDGKHLFMADCDAVDFKQLFELDGFYDVVISSARDAHRRHIHLYGPPMSWEEMNNIWDQMLKLKCIDPFWPRHQIRNGQAVLRATNNFKTYVPSYTTTIENLRRFPWLHAL